jgi:hypothetical protein
MKKKSILFFLIFWRSGEAAKRRSGEAFSLKKEA